MVINMSVMSFLNTKAKAFVVFLFSLISVALIAVAAFLGVAVFKEFYGLAAAITLMILAIPFHLQGKKRKWTYTVSFLMNSVANGFSVSTYYSAKNIDLSIEGVLLAVIPAVGILLLVYLMLQTFNKTKKVTVTVACILNGALTVALTVLWIIYGWLIFSFGFFCSLISFFYLCVFGITVNHDERSVLRDISFGSFGSFIIITVVVIFILSEGEILEGFDGLDFGGSGKNSKKKK